VSVVENDDCQGDEDTQV